MTCFVRVDQDRIVEVIDFDPAGIYGPAFKWHPCAPPARVGMRYDALTRTAQAPDATQVSPVQFKLLFTPAERVAIQAARATDPVIEDFMAIVEDPRLTHVDLGLKSTREALAYLSAQGLITAERAQAILSGVLQ